MHARDCQRQIDKGLALYRKIQSSGKHRHAVTRLKRFRNRWLAHSLMIDLIDAVPQYDQLYLLMDAARDLIDAVKLAVRGDNLDFREVARINRKHADSFWRMALLGERED